MNFSSVMIILVCKAEDGVWDGKDFKVILNGKVKIKNYQMHHQY